VAVVDELSIGAAGDPGAVFAALSSAYTVLAEPAEAIRWTCLDTADWRLFRAGLSLREIRRGARRELVVIDPAGVETTTTLRGAVWPARVDRLEPSPVRDRLAAALGSRALVAVAEGQTRRVALRLLDRLDKTRVRVCVDQHRLVLPTPAVLPAHVIINPLRGYGSDGRRCAELLAELIGAVQPQTPLLTSILAAAGLHPERIPATARLDPHEPAARAIALALHARLDVLDYHRGSANTDLDPESVVEIADAAAETGATLRVAGDLLPGDYAVRFGPEFTWLIELTTPLRRLDVALRSVADNAADGLPALAAIRPLLIRRRRAALATVRAGLRSERMTVLVRRWRVVLDSLTDAEIAGQQVGAVAGRRAADAHRELVAATTATPATTATAATPATTADDLARLQHACETMRAAVLTFEAVYRPDVCARVLADLSGLHANLADRADCALLRAQFDSIATAWSGRKGSLDTTLAIGGLLERLARHDRELSEATPRLVRRCVGSKASDRVAGWVEKSAVSPSAASTAGIISTGRHRRVEAP
jgi:hypothetical protein